MSVGGGKSGGSQSDPAAGTLAAIAEGFARESQPLRQNLLAQLNNVMADPSGHAKGGIQVPLIAQAVQATRRASSDAQKQTAEGLARTGQAGTPFGQRLMSETRQTGNLAAADTQTNVMKALYNLVPNLVLGQSQTAMSGLSGAVGGNVSGKGKSAGIGKS